MRLSPLTPLRSTGAFRAILRGVRAYFAGRRSEQHIAHMQFSYGLKANLVLAMDRQLQRFMPSVRLWKDERAFRRICKLLTKAKRSIAIQMFIWRDDEAGRLIAGHLLDAADRGVSVRIVKEAVGDFFETEGDFLGTKNSNHPLWRRFWRHPRITVSYEANRNHAKTYVIDGSLLLITGMNIGNEYRHSWHDYLVELRGVHFVQQFLEAAAGPTNAWPVRVVMNTAQSKNMRPEVTRLLSSARHSIVMEQAYLSDPHIIDMLTEATRKNVDVTVILPQDPPVHHNANLQAVSRLMSAAKKKRLRVYLYPGMVHGKILLIDRKTAFIGSANMMKSSLDDMGEVNVLIDHQPKRALSKLRRILLQDMLLSRSMTDPPYFPLIRRFLGWMYM